MHAHHVPPPLAGSTSARGVGGGRGSGKIAGGKLVAIYHAGQQHKAALQDADARKQVAVVEAEEKAHHHTALSLHKLATPVVGWLGRQLTSLSAWLMGNATEQPAAPQQALHGKLALHLHVMVRHMKEEGAATAEAAHKQVVAAATQSKQEAIMAAHAMDDAQSKQVAIYHAEQQHTQVALEKPEERAHRRIALVLYRHAQQQFSSGA